MVVRPAMMYGVDTRALKKVQELDVGEMRMLTISVRQAAVAAQRSMTFQYGRPRRPLERHS